MNTLRNGNGQGIVIGRFSVDHYVSIMYYVSISSAAICRLLLPAQAGGDRRVPAGNVLFDQKIWNNEGS